MRNLWTSFWNDDRGLVVTAETALLASMAAVGVAVGVSSAAKSVNAELREASRAFRSLDQSYTHHGFATDGAATAGSAYQQPAEGKAEGGKRKAEGGKRKTLSEP